MRHSLFLLAAVLIALSLYTAYGLATFESDKPYEFSFAEPKLPPDIVGLSQQKEVDPTLTPEMAKQTEAAVTQMSQAVRIYQNYEKTAPQQAVSTFSVLNSAILNGKLPAYLLSATKSATGMRSFESLTLNTTNTAVLDEKSKGRAVTCTSTPDAFADILIGDAGDNDIKCNAPTGIVPLDRMFLGGPGNDIITSAAGNSIINGGSGNDTITVGDGRMVLILEDGWGNDTLTFSCKDAQVFPAEIPQGFPVPWVQKNVNFIVLSPRINPADIAWDGLVLNNNTTGDTLSVNQNCFNVVGSTGAVVGAPTTPAPASTSTTTPAPVTP